MKRRSHAKMRDANEPAIVRILRALGCTVVLLDGPVDLLVGHRRFGTALVEVKNGVKPPSSRPLTPDEASFIATWPARVLVVRSAEEAVCALGLGRHPGKLHDGACECGRVADPQWFAASREAGMRSGGARRGAVAGEGG